MGKIADDREKPASRRIAVLACGGRRTAFTAAYCSDVGAGHDGGFKTLLARTGVDALAGGWPRKHSPNRRSLDVSSLPDMLGWDGSQSAQAQPGDHAISRFPDHDDRGERAASTGSSGALSRFITKTVHDRTSSKRLPTGSRASPHRGASAACWCVGGRIPAERLRSRDSSDTKRTWRQQRR